MWFKSKPKFKVCTKCHVCFEPTLEALEEKYLNLCSTHRKEVMELDQRFKVVLSWASKNWLRLEEQAKKEIEEIKNSYANALGQASNLGVLQNIGLAGLNSTSSMYRGQSASSYQDAVKQYER